MARIEIDKELEELWSLTEDLISESKRKSRRSGCRIGTTIEYKNDKKRVDESRELEEELRELADIYFLESGKLEEALLRNGQNPEEFLNDFRKYYEVHN